MNLHVQTDALFIELRALLADVLDVDETLIDPDTHFINDLGVDSLMALEVMVSLERKYKVKLTEDDLKQMSSLQRVYELMRVRIDPTIAGPDATA